MLKFPLSALGNRVPRRALTVPRSLTTTLPTAVDCTTPEFIQRQSDMKLLEIELANLLQVVHQGGGTKAIAKVRAAGRGKLLVRERYVPLLPSRLMGWRD